MIAYLPADRRQALEHGESLPDRTIGSALFADISGFTPLAEAMARELGPQRGAEELTACLNRVFDALIAEVDRYQGSVVGFSGDAITCWFDRDWGNRATASALAMQEAIHHIADLTLPSGTTSALALKASVAAGPARRFAVGEPQIQRIDVLAGSILDELAVADHHAQRGEVILTAATVSALGRNVRIREWRKERESVAAVAVVDAMNEAVLPSPWPATQKTTLQDEELRPWLLPAVYDRLCEGRGEFLAELRPAVALFLRFTGINYSQDQQAGDQLDAFVRHVQQILNGYEGSLLQLTIGDKGSYLYAAFGAPVAHEDDAVRAASAAMELRASPGQFPFLRSVQIGITQGRMRAGAYGGATRRTYGVMGSEVNLAARLMEAAKEGQILIQDTVQQEIARHFLTERLNPIRVKGRETPVAISQLVGTRLHGSRGPRTEKTGVPLVGRESELALIRVMLARVVQGEGQVLGISGEAGIGKSRIAAELAHMAREQGVFVVEGECQSYAIHASYMVWKGIWKGLLGLDTAAKAEVQLDTLEMRLKRIDARLSSRMPLLSPLLDVAIPDNNLTRTFDAKLRKMSLEALLIELLRARAGESPLLIILDNAQWLDALSEDLVHAFATMVGTLPVMLVMVYRPAEPVRSERAELRRLTHFHEIHLTALAPREAENLVRLKLRQLLEDEGRVPSEWASRVAARSEGNPFYIEEVLSYFHARGMRPGDEVALSESEWPRSLHSLVLSRIDQLAESQKVTLRVASVIGRVFEAPMLWSSYPDLGEPERVLADLEGLSRHELITPVPTTDRTYHFRHIVTQEVAYDSLPFDTRARLHQLIGGYLERTYRETVDQQLDLLAFHYGRSHDEPKKREYLLRAGEAAQANYANAAAIDYYARVLPLLSPGERTAVEINLGQVQELMGKWDEAQETYRHAREHAASLEDQRGEAWADLATGELLRKRGRLEEAHRWLDAAKQAYEALGDEAGLGQVLHTLGSVAAQRGEHSAAQALYDASLTIRRKLGDKAQMAALLSNLGIVARTLGNCRAARQLHEEGLAIRRELGDRRAIAVSLNNLGNVAIDLGDYAEARARLEEAVKLQREVGDRAFLANAIDNLGNAARLQGDTATARQLYRESLSISWELGDWWNVAYVLEDLGCLESLEGFPDRALRLVGTASALRESIGTPLSSVERAKLEKMLESAHRVVDEEERENLLAAGRSSSLNQVVSEALGSPEPRKSATGL
jgi:predicted ATPase/class 3 adenylate cyclase